ncbi:hypothetical protein [Chryseobacterium sp. Leaf394]|uniref:hypothetical protein n=1 Tax=Chryseobacterium sp. Leaf394 TaxID=1736361 RepID=UPI000A8AC6DD|nr:hypothetical protein [Chryseobacterium sp. Leaf394]
MRGGKMGGGRLLNPSGSLFSANNFITIGFTYGYLNLTLRVFGDANDFTPIGSPKAGI